MVVTVRTSDPAQAPESGWTAIRRRGKQIDANSGTATAASLVLPNPGPSRCRVCHAVHGGCAPRREFGHAAVVGGAGFGAALTAAAIRSRTSKWWESPVRRRAAGDALAPAAAVPPT